MHPLAGKPAPREWFVDVPRLMAAYYAFVPDPDDPAQGVAFGTSGHRGSSLRRTFNETHVLAVAQAVAEERAAQGVRGPLFLGKDTHALSEAAFVTAVEVLAANGVDVVVQEGFGYTPTPVISHAILCWNRAHPDCPADGVLLTPSHNPPEDGGFKYNPPSGGPASPETTKRVQERANALIRNGLRDVRRMPFERAVKGARVRRQDYVAPYARDLASILDMEAIREAKLKIGADPLGGSGIAFWEPIASMYGLDLEITNRFVDPTFGFMPVDADGKIRMDCSSPSAMANLIALRDRFDVAFGNDPDFDRHGIVTRSAGLLNPNAYLAVAVDYLFHSRPGWRTDAAVGKTLVSSSLIDRVAASIGRKLLEVPVGFKWFVDGLLDGSCGFGGEESAGASFLRMDGTAWSTDKDGIIMDLLAAEITAKTGRDPGERYESLVARLGRPFYARIDAPATGPQKAVLAKLSPDQVTATELAGEPIVARLTKAPGNGASIGGLKVVAENAWFAARPSGTEDVYKVYAESFLGEDHLKKVQEEAVSIVNATFAAAGVKG